jgi:hypothetical protein
VAAFVVAVLAAPKAELAYEPAVAIVLVTVVEKLESSFKAAANSFNVFNAEGAESIRLETEFATYSSVARGLPPAVEPSITTTVSLVVSTNNSPTAPVTLAKFAVVSLLNCNVFAIFD